MVFRGEKDEYSDAYGKEANRSIGVGGGGKGRAAGSKPEAPR